jgi:hypothetical protein
MKAIQYVMTDRKGEVKTFGVKCLDHLTDGQNLDLFAPEKLRGNAAVTLDKYLGRGFSLSNWHVIEAEAAKS